MKTLVAVIKATGDLCCLVPLYPDRGLKAWTSDSQQWFVTAMSFEDHRPMAYAVDMDLDTCPLLNADLVNEYVTILGEL